MTKSCQDLWTLRTHLTGVLVHGTGSLYYYDYLQWSHDCNHPYNYRPSNSVSINQAQGITTEVTFRWINVCEKIKQIIMFLAFSLFMIEHFHRGSVTYQTSSPKNPALPNYILRASM